MTFVNLIVKNVYRNLQDYLIYFLTLTISVSLFYAFNSISSQPAFSEMGMTKKLLYHQLGILISALSIVIAIVLAFLIIYANQFLLKRRKKELGIYMILGMKKGRISRIFAGEALCIGFIALLSGLLFGIALSQGLSLISLKLFAIKLSKFQMVFSRDAFWKTIFCFAVIFLIVMLFNVLSVSNVALIDLLTASRKNESLKTSNKLFQFILFIASLGCIITSGILFSKNGILPSRKNMSFQIASTLLIIGTLLFFYSASSVLIRTVQSNKEIYLKGLNTFLVRQIASKIRTNYLVMAIVCGLLTITICAVSSGVSTSLAMNELASSSTPYDLNVFSDVKKNGDTDVAAYLKANDADIASYAKKIEQISSYEGDITYGELFKGQNIKLSPIDKPVTSSKINVISISDFNRAMAIQGKKSFVLNGNKFLLNCNYKGTLKYVENALKSHQTLSIGGVSLKAASKEVLKETYFMNYIGNNDRGTLIVPDSAAKRLSKDSNILLVKYKSGTNSDKVLQKILPIGLDNTHWYRYTEKNMMYDMYYGTNALVAFLCSYIGLIFLLICAALLALKQLTETTDNLYRYGLLQKLGANSKQINRTLLSQTAVFFAAPLVAASVFSIVLMNKAIELVENFMHIYISTNVVFTAFMLLIVYGSYFLATYLSCKRMVAEHQYEIMEV